MLLVIAVCVFPYFNSFCQEQDIKTQLLKLKNWTISEFQTGTTDTTNNKTIPDSEIHIVLKNKSDSSINCLHPILEFYPIELKNTVEKRIVNYLILRSALYPPPPQKFSNTTYYVVIWNLKDYDIHKCCDCENLKMQLKTLLQLSPIKFASSYDFLETN